MLFRSIYYLLQDSAGFDNLMHGKSPKKNQKQRSLEDFGKFICSSSARQSVTNSFNSRLPPACLHPAREDRIKGGEESDVLGIKPRCFVLYKPCQAGLLKESIMGSATNSRTGLMLLMPYQFCCSVQTLISMCDASAFRNTSPDRKSVV